MTEEILDLVNENDEVIGSMSRREIYEQGLQNFRIVHGFLRNAEGKLWIPRRQAHKKIAPSGLDFSVAGHVESGESYEQAFKRETQEELNLDVNTLPWRVVGQLTPKEGSHFYETLYEISYDSDPEYNPHDFAEAWWLTPAEALEKIAHETSRCKFDLELTLKKFYL